MAKKKLFDKLGTWFTKVFNDVFGEDFGDELITDFKSWLKGSTGGGATNRDKELADISLENQEILNEQEFQRKKEWFDNYESPEAKVRQYSAAGLNPMLLAGGGASVSSTGGIGSAGSAPADSSGSPTDLFQTAMQLGMYKVQKNAIRTQTLKEQEEANRIRIENKWNERLKELDVRAKEQNIELARTQGALNLANLEKVAADTTFAKIYAQYAPDLFDVQIKQGLSTSAMNEAAAERNRAEASLSEARISEVESIVSRNEAEFRQIDSLISKMRAEIQLIGAETNLTNQQKEESIKRCSKLDEDIKLIGKQIGLTDKDIEWYAANHTEVVDYDTSSAANPGAVFKDKSGVYTVFTNGKVNFRRPYQPGAANKPSKK